MIPSLVILCLWALLQFLIQYVKGFYWVQLREWEMTCLTQPLHVWCICSNETSVFMEKSMHRCITHTSLCVDVACCTCIRTSLPAPMFSRNDFSIWSILRNCIGMVRIKLCVVFISHTSSATVLASVSLGQRTSKRCIILIDPEC